MDYEETESGIKIFDKRKAVRPPKRSFVSIFIEVFLFFLSLALAFGALLAIGQQIDKWISRSGFEYSNLLNWFWAFDIYMQIIIGGAFTLITISLIVSIGMYLADDD